MGKCEYHYIEVMACPSGTFIHALYCTIAFNYLYLGCWIKILSTYALIISLQVV
jgi:hypothetical protein